MAYWKRVDIWKVADEIRNKFCESNNAPVDVEYIWEIGLGREIRPTRNLGGRGTEAMLFGDLTVIAVDEAKFCNDAYYTRMRFSIAHEMGHYFLHCTENDLPRFKDKAEWFAYYENLNDNDYKWLENNANEFAGRLLVPRHCLEKAVVDGWDKLQETIDTDQIKDLPNTPDYFAKTINSQFQVSSDCISRRLRAEDLWPPEKFGR